MATSRRFPIGCTLSLMLGSLALNAQAEPPAPSASNNNGLMSFPNVRVENAPVVAPQAEPSSAATSAGLKAYLDANGNLREALPTDASVTNTITRVGVAGGKVAASTADSSEEPTFTYGPDQAVGMKLTDEHMVFSVAHKDANGNLTQQCVTGEQSAEHALHSHDHAASKEISNDR